MIEVVGAVLLLLAGIGIGVAAEGSGSDPSTATPTAPGKASVSPTRIPTSSPSDSPSDEPTATEVTKSSFILRVKITDKQCFGSAGCNLEYEIVPTYTGHPLSNLDGLTFDVTYRVTGDESGPQIGTLSFTGSKYDSQTETAQTTSTDVPLKATVTEVEQY